MATIEENLEALEDLKSSLKNTLTNKGFDMTSTPFTSYPTLVQAMQKTPTETLSITENGTYDVSEYASADVNVEGGGGGGEDVDDYVRPSDWLTIPTMSGTSDEIYILNAVMEDATNTIFFKVSGSGTIDWGDGSPTVAFNSSSETPYSHQYNYSDLPSSSYTAHNNSRQALIHIYGSRGAITRFNARDVAYSYVNDYGSSISLSSYITRILQINGNVQRSFVALSPSASNGATHGNLEIFNWEGENTATDFQYFFYKAYSLRSVNAFDISHATNLSYMFNECYSIKTIPLFDTSSVTNMNGMFSTCRSLPTIPQLNTSSVTNMNSMFSGCTHLKSIPMLDTSNVIQMRNTFSTCYRLETIPLLDTSNVTNMASMFKNCETLKTIPLLNTGAVTQMDSMFQACRNLISIPQLNTSNVTIMSSMFSGCENLQTIPLLNTSNVTIMQDMFSACVTLQTVPLLDTSKVTNAQSMFGSCYKLSRVSVGAMPVVTNVQYMFASCTNLISIESLDLSNVTSVNGLLQSASALEVLPVLDCSLLKNNPSISDCRKLKKLVLYNCGANAPNANIALYMSDLKIMSNQAWVDLMNSLAPYTASGSYKHTFSLGSTIQGYLSNVYVKDSGVLDSYVINGQTVTATWNKYVICESTDAGAMLALDYVRNIKGWTVT